jgi:hypothetical protein
MFLTFQRTPFENVVSDTGWCGPEGSWEDGTSAWPEPIGLERHEWIQNGPFQRPTQSIF